MTLNHELLNLLACPKCKGDLALVDREKGLHCSKCRLIYPIRDEIPIMLVEEAVEETAWEGSLKP